MPNIASVLKDEIARIARKESRRSLDIVQKTVVQHRRYIAALRKQISTLDRQVVRLSKLEKGNGTPVHSPDKPMRFVAGGLRSLRKRLGLSAADLGQLVGVSAQSVYNWERKVTKPRTEQFKLLAELRGVGRREAMARLDALSRKS